MSVVSAAALLALGLLAGGAVVGSVVLAVLAYTSLRPPVAPPSEEWGAGLVEAPVADRPPVTNPPLDIPLSSWPEVVSQMQRDEERE
jgi:hypothetical protein